MEFFTFLTWRVWVLYLEDIPWYSKLFYSSTWALLTTFHVASGTALFMFKNDYLVLPPLAKPVPDDPSNKSDPNANSKKVK
jgi:hypothetical protein